MKKDLLSVVFAMAMSLGGASAFAGDLDNQPLPNPLEAGHQYWSTTGNVTAQGGTVELEGGAAVTIGGAGSGFSTSIGRLQQVNSDPGAAVLNIEDTGSGGVKLTVGALALNEGSALTINLDASASASSTNELIITQLEQQNANADTAFTVGANSRLTIRGIDNNKFGGANKLDLTLNGAQAVIANGVTLVKGTIAAAGGAVSSLAAGGSGLTVKGAAVGDAVLSVGGSSTLNVVTSVKTQYAASDYANVTVGGTAGEIDINNGVMNLGNLTLNTDAAFSAMSATGELNVFGNLKVNTDFADVDNIVTTVHGTTEVAANKTYTVSGTQNNYQGAMTLAGTLAYGDFAGGAIKMGSYVNGNPVSMGSITVKGGDIAVAGGDFKIDNADILVTQANLAGDTIGVAAMSTLDLSTSDLTIKLDAPTATNNTVGITTGMGIALRGYAQLAGKAAVDATASGGRLVVEQPAVIGSVEAGTEVALDVAGDAVVFNQGLTLDTNGAVTALNSPTGKITLGSAANAADLVLNGNNKLYAANSSTLMFASGHADGARMIVGGKNNVAYGEIDSSPLAASVRANGQLTVATDHNPASTAVGLKVASMTVSGDLLLGSKTYPGGAMHSGVVSTVGGFTVAAGGRVVADYRDAYLNGNAGVLGDAALTVAKGGALVADTAAVNARGYASVDIDGMFTAGALDGVGAAARLRTDSDVTIGSTGVISLTSKLAATAIADENAAVATRLIETDLGKTIASKAPLANQSMLGAFNFALNDAQNVLYIKTASGRVSLDGSYEDRLQALHNLRDMWGGKQVNSDFGGVIYDVVKGDTVSNGSAAGDKNVSLLDAIANPAGRAVGLDTVEYVNGAHLYGVTDAAIETSRTFMSDMTNRAKAVNCQFVAMRDSAGSSDALASTAMNAELNNRIWFGGAGLWQKAEKKDDFSGYSYDGYGIVGGYDRVVAQNLAMGASFSYLKGDYEDKGALASDSDIESFSAGLYGTYSGGGGFFGTLYGAYTYSSNNIRELRNDPFANRSAWAVSDFHTGTWSVGGLAGYDFRLAENLVITPAAGVNYIRAQNSDHESFLDGVATQGVKKAKNHGVFLPVEMTVQYDMCIGEEGKLRFEGVAGYAYNMNKDGMKGTIDYYGLEPASGVGIHGRENVKHHYKLGLGVRYALRSFDVGVKYDYSGASGYKAHRAMGTIGLAF